VQSRKPFIEEDVEPHSIASGFESAWEIVNLANGRDTECEILKAVDDSLLRL
jgi:hypothetical protein